MRYAKLGNSGLSVSKVCLGAMSFGDANSGTHAWTLSEIDSREIIKNALDAGFFVFLQNLNQFASRRTHTS